MPAQLQGKEEQKTVSDAAGHSIFVLLSSASAASGIVFL